MGFCFSFSFQSINVWNDEKYMLCVGMQTGKFISDDVENQTEQVCWMPCSCVIVTQMALVLVCGLFKIDETIWESVSYFLFSST